MCIYPSHQKAYMTKIISESTNEFVNVSVDIIEESQKPLLIPINNKQVINYIKEQSCNIKSIKESFDVFYDKITLLENGRQVQMLSKDGDTLIVNLENYIQDEIMDYCYKNY